jgi:hypothetical protein
MEGFNTPAGSGDYSDPLANAAEDIRKRCGSEVQVYWDGENRSADYDVHKLKVIARDLPMVFPVEHDVLVERGKPYEGFLDTVAAQVSEALKGEAPTPPTS